MPTISARRFYSFALNPDPATVSAVLHIEHLKELFTLHGDAARAPIRNFSISARDFDWAHESALMGVVNLSADSWHRESVCLSADAAIERGNILATQGAAIIDVGAESTLAHAERVGGAAQSSVLLPVVRELSHAGLVVSVETYRPDVTRACLEAGAKVLNLTGPGRSAEMYRMVAEHSAAVIICFVEGNNVREVSDYSLAEDPIPRLHEYFAREIETATKAGVERIFIDPGMGFYYSNLQDSSVRVRHQITTFINSFRLRTLGWPICHALPHAFEYFKEEVRSAEPFFAVLASLGKANLYRTHEVARVRAVLETLNAF